MQGSKRAGKKNFRVWNPFLKKRGKERYLDWTCEGKDIEEEGENEVGDKWCVP